jgi:hypothetical protein
VRLSAEKRDHYALTETQEVAMATTEVHSTHVSDTARIGRSKPGLEVVDVAVLGLDRLRAPQRRCSGAEGDRTRCSVRSEPISREPWTARLSLS